MNWEVIELSDEVSQASLEGQTDLDLNSTHSPPVTANHPLLPVWSWNFKFVNVTLEISNLIPSFESAVRSPG